MCYEQNDVGGDGRRVKVLLVLEGVATECGADDDQRRRAAELRLLLSPCSLLQVRQRARAQHAETPGVGPMVVWCPTCELEQFVEGLAVNGLGPEGLVGATGTNRLLDIHRLRIAFRETPRQGRYRGREQRDGDMGRDHGAAERPRVR